MDGFLAFVSSLILATRSYKENKLLTKLTINYATKKHANNSKKNIVIIILLD